MYKDEGKKEYAEGKMQGQARGGREASGERERGEGKE